MKRSQNVTTRETVPPEILGRHPISEKPRLLHINNPATGQENRRAFNISDVKGDAAGHDSRD